MIRKILNNDSCRMATFLVTLIGAMWTLTTRLEDRSYIQKLWMR